MTLYPSASRPDITGSVLSTEQRTLIQAVYDHLSEHGRWPTVREIRIRFHEEFDVEDEGRTMPSSLFMMDDLSAQGGTCRLPLAALFYCGGATSDRDAAARYIQHLGHEYVHAADEKLSIAAAQKVLGLDDDQMHRIMMLLQHESILTRGSTSDANGRLMEVTISHDALMLKGVKNLEDYFRIRDAHFTKRDEQRRARNGGFTTATPVDPKESIERTRQLRRQLERARNILAAAATGRPADSAGYSQLREELLNASALGDDLPDMLHTSGTVGELVEQLKAEGTSYAERRARIHEAFAPVLAVLAGESPPHAVRVEDTVQHAQAVRDAWEKALSRQDSDPAGAITSARTLVEATLRHALDELGVSYSPSSDLPMLYKLFKNAVQLGPTEGAEQAVVRILGSSQGLVDGLAAMRNQMSDAHAGIAASAVEVHFAELAVNLAGTMALFIMQSVTAAEER